MSLSSTGFSGAIFPEACKKILIFRNPLATVGSESQRWVQFIKHKIVSSNKKDYFLRCFLRFCVLINYSYKSYTVMSRYFPLWIVFERLSGYNLRPKKSVLKIGTKAKIGSQNGSLTLFCPEYRAWYPEFTG